MFEASPRARVRVLAVISALAAIGALAAPAAAKPPAPGAPGTIHRWAPADKHGFGTAHQLESKAWFTLRQGSLSEVYYPNLSTPGFRGLQFAISDGRGLLQRETVDDDPRHIEPLADGVTSRVESVIGSLEFRQVTEGTGWRLTKTWITDPARATVVRAPRLGRCSDSPKPAPCGGSLDGRLATGADDEEQPARHESAVPADHRRAWIRAVRVPLLLSADAGVGGAPIARRRAPARRPEQVRPRP